MRHALLLAMALALFRLCGNNQQVPHPFPEESLTEGALYPAKAVREDLYYRETEDAENAWNDTVHVFPNQLDSTEIKVECVTLDTLCNVFNYYDARYIPRDAHIEYFETIQYYFTHKFAKYELATERVLHYFFYDINRDGRKELWVLLEIPSGDWMYVLFDINRNTYDVKEIERIYIPRFSTTYKGKGSLIIERYKWGWEEWDKLYWDKGLKMELIHKRSILPADNNGREDLDYSHPREPEMPVEEFNRDLLDLLMIRIFQLEDD